MRAHPPRLLAQVEGPNNVVGTSLTRMTPDASLHSCLDTSLNSIPAIRPAHRRKWDWSACPGTRSAVRQCRENRVVR
eukprot:7383486-Prymnesium_polylepis.1